MFFQAPEYTNRTATQIIEEKLHFDSVGYTYRGLSWLDLAKRQCNISALQYAAWEIRMAIEQLFFEELVLSVGGELDRAEYEKCKGSATKLHKIIRNLSPKYSKLAEFTKALLSVEPGAPPIVSWDHRILLKHWGKVSNLLHWGGAPDETTESDSWFTNGLRIVDAAASYIWEQKRAGYTGVMLPKYMHPEIRAVWERYEAGDTDLEGVKSSANILRPLLVQNES